LTADWLARYAPDRFSGEISHSILFFIVFNFAGAVINLPLSYYKAFYLEEAFGFNKQTKSLVGSLGRRT
jgi:STE24 endopeptidase